jgi:hypothetical protein
MWQSKLNVQADRIGLVVSGTGANASIKAAEIVASINSSGSSVTISADKIILSGETVASAISSDRAAFQNLVTGEAEADYILANRLGATNFSVSNNFMFHNYAVIWKLLRYTDSSGQPAEVDVLARYVSA